jgi:hypothetical protein
MSSEIECKDGVPETEQFHAWYSPRQDATNGSAIYAREDGERVVVTEVSSSYKQHGWPDAEYLGIVVSWISSSERSYHHNLKYW